MFRSQSEFERDMMPQAQNLLRFAHRMCPSRPAAEDLVQETLLRAWRSFSQFQPGTNAKAWLFRILLNVFYEQGRRLRALPETVPMIDHLSDRGAASSVQESLEVRQALAALPEDHRAVILLVVVEGFTNREAAEILGLPVGTVMSRISRARHSLREKLSACTHSGKEC